MVRINVNGELYIKLLYWGCAGSGKTTAVDTLYRLTKEQFSDSWEPTEDLTKIQMDTGSTLYFDRGIFQSKKSKKVFYHIYTVAGQKHFGPLRKRIYEGTDGIIFVFDGQKSRLEDNLESLRELQNVVGPKLIREIPFLVMVNKKDLPNTLTKKEVEDLLAQNDLFFKPGHELYEWNPIVYETIALYSNALNVFQVYSELARRTAIYQAYGKGMAPEKGKPSTLPDKPPDM